MRKSVEKFSNMSSEGTEAPSVGADKGELQSVGRGGQRGVAEGGLTRWRESQRVG
jgi:hypothetical protein